LNMRLRGEPIALSSSDEPQIIFNFMIESLF
jgi:hypothetical protein